MFVITDHSVTAHHYEQYSSKKNRNENPHPGFLYMVIIFYFLSTYFFTGLIPIFSKDSLNGS